jgi:Glycosyltransferase family 87
MNRKRSDAVVFIALGGLTMVLLGLAGRHIVGEPLADLQGIYFPARCLLQHCDPYAPDQVLRVYRQAGADAIAWRVAVRQIATQLPYPPSVFSIGLPMALLPWSAAQRVWLILTASGLIFASFLIWNMDADHAPLLGGLLAGFLLGNSEVLIIAGNAVGLVVSLCAVAVWCFVRKRFEVAGIACLALSLAVKPQDAGFVWLYFLLAGGTFRKRAWQTLLAVTVLSLACAVAVWHASPHWLTEVRTNIAAYSVPGGINDPSPKSSGGHGLAMIVDLQAVFSVFRDDPHFYNTASYLVCAPLLLVWMMSTLRGKSSPLRMWLGLAAIAGLTMLPVYHRQYDTKLLLLTVPACAMLWAGGSRAGRVAVLLNCAAFVLNGDLTWAVILAIVRRIPVQAGGFGEHVMVAVQAFPAPLSLLASSVAFLWLYVRSGREDQTESLAAARYTESL